VQDGAGNDAAALADEPVVNRAVSGTAVKVSLTGPTTVEAGEVSSAFTLTAQDASGEPATVLQPTVFTLSSSSPGDFAFFSDAAGTTPITQATIPTGASTVTFYYRDTKAASPTLTAKWASGGEADLGSDDYGLLIVDPAEPASVILTGPNSVMVGAVAGPFTVTVLDQFGNPTPVIDNTIFGLDSKVTVSEKVASTSAGFSLALAKRLGAMLERANASAIGEFYADSAASDVISQVAIAAGNSSVNFFFRPEKPGNVEVIATRTSGDRVGAASLSQDLDVVANVTLAGPDSVDAGKVSGAFTLTTRDVDGEPTSVTMATTFELTSSSTGSVAFYSDPDGKTPITRATIAVGDSAVHFYYRDTRAALQTVHAGWASGGADLGSADAKIRVVAVPPPSPETTTITASPDSILADGKSASIVTVQLRDVFGNDLNEGGAKVTLATTTGELSALLDNGDGTYTAKLTSTWVAGSAVISGVLNGEPIVDTDTVAIAGDPSAPSGLVIDAVPDSVFVDSTMTVEVRVVDGAGAPVTDFSGKVALELVAGPDSTALADTAVVVAAEGGIARFRGLRIDQPGTGYVLQATDSAGHLAPVRSQPFTVVLMPADLQVEVVASQAEPAVGDTLTYTVAALNRGPGEARGVEITVPVPQRFDLVSAKPESGSYDAKASVWSIPRLENGGSVALVLTVVVRE
ncbi:MAG TPA: invasin domain 3-containing protein, partial [Longimicrobiaceae bacterium]|nr:invasin domain 3-containing protein [Longimicrobiaceae bacterium]